MSYQKDRNEFLAVAQRNGITCDQARSLLRYAQTLKRLAETECNGDDWQTGNLQPCPNVGKEGAWCPTCAGKDGYHSQVSASSLKESRIEKRAKALLQECGVKEYQINGDPRGVILKIKLPDGTANDFCGEGYFCVPTRY